MPTDKENEVDDNVSFIDDDAGDTIIELGSSSKKDEPSDKDDRLRRAEEELANLRSSIQSNQQQHFGNQRQPVQMDDPFESDENNLNEREKALGISWEADRIAGKLRDPNLQSDYENKARKIQSERAQIASNRAIRNALPQLVEMNQAQMVRQQYNDVLSHGQASQYARGEYQKLVAMNPSQDGPGLLDKAMNAARIQFKLGGQNYMKPTEHDKAQMSGVGGGGGRQTTDNRVHMSKAEKSMAMALYGDAFPSHDKDYEKKVYKKWASGPGLRAKREAAKRGTV